MKNVLLTTTALVAFAGAAAADVSWSGSADVGYNDEIKGGMFYDAALNVGASMDLGDGYAASLSYGIELDMIDGAATANWGAYPTIEITAPFGSLKGGDLGDEGASEYFYADRSGMTQDVENHDSGARFDVRALAEFGAFGVAVGGQDDGAGGFSGINYGAGGTFGDISFGLGYDDDDNGVQVTAVSADTTFNGITVGVSYAAAVGSTASFAVDANDAAAAADPAVEGTDFNTTTTVYDENSIGLELGFEVSSDLSVGAYYANNSVAGDAYGVSASYTTGALTVGAYFDHTVAYGYPGTGVDADADGYEAGAGTLAASENDEWGIDVSYAVSADLTAYAGYFDDGTGVSYVGATYAFNDSLSATVSYAEADEISGPEFKNGTTVMLSASF
jgi:hypothetical protein